MSINKITCGVSTTGNLIETVNDIVDVVSGETITGYAVTAKAKAGTNVIQPSLVLDLDSIPGFTSGVCTVSFRMISSSEYITSAQSRAFQSDSATAGVAFGTQFSPASLGGFSGDNLYSRQLTINRATGRYLSFYAEAVCNNTTEFIDFFIADFKLVYQTTTIDTVINYALYQPATGDTIAAGNLTDGGLLTKTEAEAIYVKKTDLVSESNILTGKKMVTIGDSMVKGHSLPSTSVWDYLIADRNNMTLVNYGVNGIQMVDDNAYGSSVLNRYSTMDNDADYVVVFAGTNDANSVKTMGADTDSVAAGQNTFKGGLNDLCKGLITKYPSKRIMFITPYLRNANYLAYIEAIKSRCAAHSIPVYDNYTNGGVMWSNTAQTAALTLGDSFHLNAAGMAYASTKYESKLKSL